jgi:hypothetical protein
MTAEFTSTSHRASPNTSGREKADSKSLEKESPTTIRDVRKGRKYRKGRKTRNDRSREITRKTMETLIGGTIERSGRGLTDEETIREIEKMYESRKIERGKVRKSETGVMAPEIGGMKEEEITKTLAGEKKQKLGRGTIQEIDKKRREINTSMIDKKRREIHTPTIGGSDKTTLKKAEEEKIRENERRKMIERRKIDTRKRATLMRRAPTRRNILGKRKRRRKKSDEGRDQFPENDIILRNTEIKTF